MGKMVYVVIHVEHGIILDVVAFDTQEAAAVFMEKYFKILHSGYNTIVEYNEESGSVIDLCETDLHEAGE